MKENLMFSFQNYQKYSDSQVKVPVKLPCKYYKIILNQLFILIQRQGRNKKQISGDP